MQPAPQSAAPADQTVKRGLSVAIPMVLIAALSGFVAGGVTMSRFAESTLTPEHRKPRMPVGPLSVHGELQVFNPSQSPGFQLSGKGHGYQLLFSCPDADGEPGMGLAFETERPLSELKPGQPVAFKRGRLAMRVRRADDPPRQAEGKSIEAKGVRVEAKGKDLKLRDTC